MKIFLLIEPSISTFPLIFKAIEKNDKIFIISNNIDHFALIKDTLNVSSLFFQANTEDHAAILYLVDKISKMFCIDAVIPGSFSSLFITSKVSAFLKKAGLSPKAVYQLSQENWLPQLQASLDNTLNEGFPEKEYKVTGFSKNNAIHILSIIEKLTSLPPQRGASGYILSPEAPYSKEIKPYFTRIIEKLSLNYAAFEAKIETSKNTFILREFNVELALPNVSELIEASMGIDYYDNVLRLFSYEKLSLYKKQFLNAGSLFFNKPYHAQLLKKHPYVKKTKLYSNHEKLFSPSLKAAGYAILTHKNYETLKNQMIKLQLICSN
ncbi:MAG: hypothetical protein K2X28_02015 [Alphaproteobacteria bacterium]|nr:hypothetical protein [Alphaproteobacteria bacterium]